MAQYENDNIHVTFDGDNQHIDCADVRSCNWLVTQTDKQVARKMLVYAKHHTQFQYLVYNLKRSRYPEYERHGNRLYCMLQFKTPVGIDTVWKYSYCAYSAIRPIFKPNVVRQFVLSRSFGVPGAKPFRLGTYNLKISKTDVIMGPTDLEKMLKVDK